MYPNSVPGQQPVAGHQQVHQNQQQGQYPGYYGGQQGGYAAPPGGYAAPQGGYAAQPGGYAPHPGGYAPHPGGYAAPPGPQQPYNYQVPPTHAGINVDHNDNQSGHRQASGGFFATLGQGDWEIDEDMKLNESVDIAIRMAFVRKVYGILAAQLTLTFGLALWFNLHTAAAVWLVRNPWLLITAMIVTCCSICAMACIPSAARTSPTNYIILFVISLAMGVVIGYSTGAVSTPAFAMAAGITAAVTLAVSLFACQTKYDFTGFGPYLFVFMIILLIFGIIAAIIRNQIVHLVYASLGALLFSFYLIVDTQTIIGGKHRKYEFSIDDYAFGALTLYLDIINLFMYILMIVSSVNDD